LIYGEQTTFERVFDPALKNSPPTAFEEAQIPSHDAGGGTVVPAPGNLPLP